LAVFSDSTFTVDIFNSLHAHPPFNNMLMSTVDILIMHGIDLQVVHLAGEDNSVTDALSCFQNSTVHMLVPAISILPFLPPQAMLGVLQQ
ncbi:hypothetical protein OG21DRAFT_1422114, partial [Imleria badia]